MQNGWRFAMAGTVVATLAAAGWVGVTSLSAQVPPDPSMGSRPMGRMGPMGPRGGWDGMRIGFALGQLDLTEEQRSQIRGIMQQHREEFRALRQRVQAARRALDAAVTAPTLDEGAVRAAAAARGEVETDAALTRARVHAEVWQVLTPEQRAKAETLRAQRHERVQQRSHYRERFKAQAPPEPPKP